MVVAVANFFRRRRIRKAEERLKHVIPDVAERLVEDREERLDMLRATADVPRR